MLRRELAKVILVKDLLPRARAVPKADPARGVFRLEQVREMRAQRSHARAAADVDHFLLRRLDMKIAERSDGR